MQSLCRLGSFPVLQLCSDIFYILSRNPVLKKKILQDLNADPLVPTIVCGEDGENGLLNASTCVVSIDYLIHPLEVLSSLRSRTAMGGSVHLVVSNRCFPTST